MPGHERHVVEGEGAGLRTSVHVPVLPLIARQPGRVHQHLQHGGGSVHKGAVRILVRGKYSRE